MPLRCRILELESSFDVTAHMEAVIGLPVSVNLTMDFVLDDGTHCILYTAVSGIYP